MRPAVLVSNRDDPVRIAYTLVFYLIQPLVMLRLLWRSLKAPAYRQRMLERYGFYGKRAAPPAPCIWVHAVSVGETIASVPLVKHLAASYPNMPLVVTTTTPTGAERATALLGDSVTHVYSPYDLPGALRRFLRHFRPQLLVIMETELWPNMIHYTAASGAAVVLANARLSAKSAAGYQRFAGLAGQMLRRIDGLAVQSDIEAQRFISLGAAPVAVSVTGNIKFDMALSAQDRDKAAAWRRAWAQGRKIWIAASTHEGEDEILLQCHQRLLQQHPNLLLILVPRHPERFDEVAQQCRDAGFSCHRLSAGAAIAEGTQLIVGDTMGDLLALYGAADIAFVGGSLIARGGHNVLEPALWSMPVLSGPHLFNFQGIAELMQAADALQLAADTGELYAAIDTLLNDAEHCQQQGRNASAVVEQNRGALQRLLRVVEQQLSSTTG